MTRRLGVDPGSAYCASTILDGDAAPCAYVDSRTDEVGHMVDREVPRVIERVGRPDLVLTKRRAPPSDTEIDALAASIVAWAMIHGVTRACVEEVTDVHFDGGSSTGAHSSVAGHLVRSGKVGAIVALRLRDAGIHVERVRHATWAGKIARTARVSPKQVKPIIVAAVTGWPVQTNEHERDAAGIALWDVVVTAEAEAIRKTPCRACHRLRGEHSAEELAACAAAMPRRIRGGPRIVKPPSPRKLAAIANVLAREQAGCTCKRRHVPPCSLFTTTLYAKALCPKCHGPLRGHLRGLPCPPLPAVTDAA